jgi:hypothetical protein
MTDPCEDVKPHEGRIQKLRYWLECHPPTGWYIAAIGTLNVMLTFALLLVSAFS